MKKFFIIGCFLVNIVAIKGNDIKKPYTVICVLEAKKGKESELKKMLIGVIEPSRNENSCLEYRLHQSLNNEAEFVLYENWISKEAHQQQFKKPYIIALVDKLNDILAKPYQTIFSEEIKR